MKEARQAVWSVGANLPLASVRTVDSYYAESMVRTSFTLVTLAIAGAMALLLGTVGLYGVIAYSVLQRHAKSGSASRWGAQTRALHGLKLEVMRKWVLILQRAKSES